MSSFLTNKKMMTEELKQKLIEILTYFKSGMDNIEASCDERQPMQDEMDYALPLVKKLVIHGVVNWLPFEKENYDKFTELCKKDKCLCLFDDGTECNYNDEHPMAIMTHFAELT